MPALGDLAERALRAAVAVAEESGLRVGRPVVLRDATNLLVHLTPAPVVARVATGTGMVREGDAWLAREVAVAGHLSRVGAPVVAPSTELPPGPHHHDGLVLSFWEHVEELDAPLDADAAGRGLRHCHEALADYDGDLPRLAVLDEAERIVERLNADNFLDDEDARQLRGLARVVRTSVEGWELPEQPVHGDAHLGNVITTTRGPLWNDWEDTFRGPVAWDLGCLHASAPPFGHRDPGLIAAVRAAYDDEHDDATIEAFVAARRFQAATWAVVLGLQREDRQLAETYLRWLGESARQATRS